MKSLLIVTMIGILLVSGCSEPRYLVDDTGGNFTSEDLGKSIKDYDARVVAHHSTWFGHGFMPGMTCGLLLMTAVLMAGLQYLIKQPYNGTIGRLEGWKGQRNIPSVVAEEAPLPEPTSVGNEATNRPVKLQNSFKLKETN